MADIRIIDESNGKEIKHTEDKKPLISQNSVSIPASQELLYNAVCEVVGLESPIDRGKYSHRVDTLIEWAREEGKANGIEEIKAAIRNLDFRLGAPSMEEKKVNILAQYAYMLMEGKRAKKERGFNKWGGTPNI